jgi:anaerobic ribonucleoside-triphosphate reductase activating protein
MNYLESLDVVVDGRFILSLKSDTVKYRGSSNQRIIDVKKSLKDNKIIQIIA